MNKHENMGIKRKTKVQKSNRKSTNDLKVWTEQLYSLIINDNLEYYILCKLANYFDYLKFKPGFSVDTNKDDFVI